MYQRKRKACLIDIGKKEYGFDLEYEEALYLFHCGSKLARKQWKKLKKVDKDNGCSYTIWKQHVLDKYSCIEDNENFNAYLKQCERNEGDFLESTKLICAACLSAMFTFILTNLMDWLIKNINGGNVINYIATVIIYIISVGSMVIVMFFVIKDVNEMISKDNVRRSMYKDIQRILKSLK